MFVSWGRPQFLLFYPNFKPLLHLQYMKIHIEALPQSCRYGKYILFATLVTPITFFGAEKFAIPCKVFSSSRQTSAKEVLSMHRNQNWSLLRQINSKSIWQISNTLDFQHVHMFKFNSQIRVGHMHHGIEYDHVNMLKIQSVWNLSDG